MADHTHDHSHTHDDHHHEGESYFIDQLCMVGLSGAFGMICLCLWFWQTKMLNLMLGEQFHLYVVSSGFVLVAIALARGIILWNQSRDPKFLHQHDHDHHHDHDHGHDHPHDHGHEHAIQEKTPLQVAVQPAPLHEHKPGEVCEHGHDHQHEHHIGHAHVHSDHDEADHDHGWAPWRYVVILVPIILFLLGLPDRAPSIMVQEDSSLANLSSDSEMHLSLRDMIKAARETQTELAAEAELDLQGLLLAPDRLSLLAYAGAACYQPPVSETTKVDFKLLDTMSARPDTRAYWKDRSIEVRGQFAPLPNNDQVFMLVRLKIQCCANDAVQLNVPMVSRDKIQNLKLGDWVKVTGRVDFRERNGSYITLLRVAKASDVVKLKDPDPNPYIQ